jgi:D-alanyl-D-alanine carboxypeptidase
MTACDPVRWLRCGRGVLAAALAASIAFMATGVQAADKSAVLIIDANTGRVLYESAADETRNPASLTKIMTLYMVFELIELKRLNLESKLKISSNAAGAAPSKLGLKEGEEIALGDAVKVVITKSANDVAVAIAEHVSGDEKTFARAMTQKARQLGMTVTTFQNASGLPDDQQVTTARDMATLALRMQDRFPQHYAMFATRTFTYKGETFRNHNSLLFNYEGTDGIKTGYTRASGFNLVASVKRGSKHVIGVVFGGASAASRDTTMRTFLNVGLIKASSEKTRQTTRSPTMARARSDSERKSVAEQRVTQREQTRIATASAAIAKAAQPIAAIVTALPSEQAQPAAAPQVFGAVPAPSLIREWALLSFEGLPMGLTLPATTDGPSLMAVSQQLLGPLLSSLEGQESDPLQSEVAVERPARPGERLLFWARPQTNE